MIWNSECQLFRRSGGAISTQNFEIRGCQILIMWKQGNRYPWFTQGLRLLSKKNVFLPSFVSLIRNSNPIFWIIHIPYCQTPSNSVQESVRWSVHGLKKLATSIGTSGDCSAIFNGCVDKKEAFSFDLFPIRGTCSVSQSKGHAQNHWPESPSHTYVKGNN